MCAAVHTVSLKHKLESCTVFGRSGNMWKNDESVLNIPVINQGQTTLRFSMNSPIYKYKAFHNMPRVD